MKLSNIEKFKGKKVIAEWHGNSEDRWPESEEGVIEEIGPDWFILEYTFDDRKKGVQKVRFEDLIYIQEV